MVKLIIVTLIPLHPNSFWSVIMVIVSFLLNIHVCGL